MEEKELEKLQRYIYKRPQGQSTQDVILHIKAIDNKEHLKKEEWNKLLIPTCSYADSELLGWLLENGAVALDESIDLARMVVGSQEKRLSYLKKRIKILDIILKYSLDKREEVLGTALINACWYNNLYVVTYLIETGGSLHYQSANGKTPYDCAKQYGERFNDYTLYNYLTDYLKKGSLLDDAEKYYSGKDIFGNQIYEHV
jgi:hypothetical protein